MTREGSREGLVRQGGRLGKEGNIGEDKLKGGRRGG